MLRVGLATLLAACLLTGCLQAQRMGVHGSAGGHRGGAYRAAAGQGFRHSHTPRNGAGSYFLPYGEFFDDEPDTEAANAPVPSVVIPRAPVPHLSEPQVIEIPSVSNSPAKELPPAVFVLASGERLEARRFVLTASNLSVSIDHRQRNVPLAMLDLDATLAANHGRGIDLRIPDDRNEISLSF
jgi:hypothetical protein